MAENTPYYLNFRLDNLKHVYVSSCRRGFLVVSDQPMCVTSASGSSGNDTIIATKRVYREDGRWVYAKPERPGQWWLKSAWLEAVSLQGGEPWRVYRLDAEEVARLLDDGAFTDDVRGFESRLEPWQPVNIDANGDVSGHPTIAAAKVWERTDGWRVVRRDDGLWVTDGSRCNADKSVLKYSPNHFDPIVSFAAERSAADAMLLVDVNRPWG